MIKKFLFVFLIALIAVPFAFACGERDVKLVDNVESYQTTVKKSSCSSELVKVDNNDVVLVNEDEIKVDQHTAQHILEDYLIQQYGDAVLIVNDEHSDVPGHEHHHHAKGRLQDSHGTISYAFLVRGGNDFYDGKAIPLYVDARNGVVYGVGCGYGAGAVVFEPDLNEYSSFLERLMHWVGG